MITDKLKELALAATPGPWTGFVDKGRLVAIMPSGRPGDICTFADPPSDADAAFMLAATPDAILALIRERDDTLAALAVAREGAKDALASLVAAVSLLERGGKKAAASDKMFGMMLSDYKASIARTRAALRDATDGR